MTSRVIAGIPRRGEHGAILHERTETAMTATLPAYAFALLRDVKLNAEIADYIMRIDATLAPFGGAFIIHGGQTEVVEGDWNSTLVAIRFPDMAHARGWYDSPAYQAILPLRTRNSQGICFVIEGVEAGYQGKQMIGKLNPC